MASIKFQIIFGIIVIFAYCDFSADGFRIKSPKIKNPFGTRFRSKTSFKQILKSQPAIKRTEIKRTQSTPLIEPQAAPGGEAHAQNSPGIWGKIGIEAAKAGTLGSTLVAANAAGTAIDMSMRGQQDMGIIQNLNEPQNRAKIDCKTNEYGCMQGMCWTNCGPRLDAGDWCFTTKNETVSVRNIMRCSNRDDCDPCWSCAGDCVASLQQQQQSK